MTYQLKKSYFILLAPSMLGFILAGWVKAYGLVEISSDNLVGIAGPFIFVFCVALAIGFPIFYRTLFAHRSRDQISVSENKLQIGRVSFRERVWTIV